MSCPPKVCWAPTPISVCLADTAITWPRYTLTWLTLGQLSDVKERINQRTRRILVPLGDSTLQVLMELLLFDHFGNGLIRTTDPENLGVDTGYTLLSHMCRVLWPKKWNFGNGHLNLHIGRHLVFSIAKTNWNPFDHIPWVAKHINNRHKVHLWVQW